MEVLPRSRGSQMRQKTNAAAAYGYWESCSAYLNACPKQRDAPRIPILHI